MASANKPLIDSAYLTTGTVTLYTVPANTRTMLLRAKLTCVSGNKTATIYVVPNGGTATAANAFISAQPIGNNETYLCPELPGVMMDEGDFIAATASANTSVSFALSGREESV